MRTTAISEGKSVLGKMLQYTLVCNQYAITTQAEVISFLRPLLLLFFGYVLVDLWPLNGECQDSYRQIHSGLERQW